MYVSKNTYTYVLVYAIAVTQNIRVS